MKRSTVSIVPAALFPVLVATAFAQNPCDKLKSLSLPDTTVSAIEFVPAGPFKAPAQGAATAPAAPPPVSAPPAGQPAARGRGAGPGVGLPGAQPVPVPVPAYCRVALVLTPSSDSHIESEVWLPVEDWNGKLQVVGNGGWAGSISYPAMASALREGYATASTDTGHKANDGGGSGMFALGHPEKIVDFGYRSLHETTLKAKAITAAFYDKGPKYSYYNGCSTGGRQGLVEVTRYPEDFDAVVAGAPANPHIHLHASSVAMSMDLRQGAQPLTEAKVATLHKAILDACDALDGVEDGLLGDPQKCHFDPSTLLCKGADSDLCLTAGEIQAVKRVFSATKTKKGETIWTGFEPGGELQYRSLTAKIDREAPPAAGALDSIRILGYQDPKWDWRTWDLDRDVAMADEKAGFIDARNFDLNAFKAHGGKLLLYHGWADPGIPPGNTVNFYKGVLAKMGSNQGDWLRLFMVPGMQHCSGGPGTDQFNKMGVIERWRESGQAPDEIIASHVTGGNIDMTRPLCPYPQVAVYKGVGSTKDYANFVCK